MQKVNVNKKWPNTLQVKLIEQKAVAIWNQNKLLNEDGNIFSVTSTDDLNSLPEIYGSDSQAKEILVKFTRFQELLTTTGFDIKAANISPRGAWIIDLSNEIRLNIGTQNQDSRLIRLVETWIKLLKTNSNMPEYIDLRYTNGYAVKWKKEQPPLNKENKSFEGEIKNG